MHLNHVEEDTFIETVGKKYLFMNICYPHVTSILGNFGLKFLFTFHDFSQRHFFTKMTKTCWGSLRFYFILILFPFQIAPLIVIVCTASVGAIAFGVRQATKNPEAWYVITVFIKPDEKSSLQRTKQNSTKTETYLIWALFLISTDEVASHVMECNLHKAFVFATFCFIFPRLLQNVTTQC